MPLTLDPIDAFVKGSTKDQAMLTAIRNATWDAGDPFYDSMSFRDEGVVSAAMDLSVRLKKAGLLTDQIMRDPENGRPEASKEVLEALGVNLNRKRQP